MWHQVIPTRNTLRVCGVTYSCIVQNFLAGKLVVSLALFSSMQLVCVHYEFTLKISTGHTFRHTISMDRTEFSARWTCHLTSQMTEHTKAKITFRA